MPGKIAAKIDSIPEVLSVNIEDTLELSSGDVLTIVVNGEDRMDDLVVPEGKWINLHITMKGPFVPTK